MVSMAKIKGSDILFVVTATVLMASCDVLYYTLHEGEPVKGFLILGANYMMALAMWVVLRVSAMVGLRRVLQPLFLLVIAAYYCLLAFCWHQFGSPLDKDMIALVTGSNNSEAGEFFDVYITPAVRVVMTLTMLLIFVLALTVTRHDFTPKRRLLRGLAVYTLVGCFCLGFSFYTLPGRIEGILRTEQKDLNKYLHHPEMEETNAVHPDVILIVIGECFVKKHSSLYGYDKVTNPRLQQQADSGRLIVYDEASAPATHTAEAFKRFMTIDDHQATDKKWYDYLTLTEVLNCAGYHTVWFSNQAQTGWYDNASSAFAKMCDHTVFTTSRADGEQGAKPDGILLREVLRYLRVLKDGSRHAVFVHLMGQHPDFHQRYPSSFEHFVASDYPTCLDSQRENYASYDNATLYNDYVVDSLFAMARDHHAVGVYFSDHGMDFYDSSDDYCSHANNSDSVSVKAGLQIPMMVYATQRFEAARPSTVEEIRRQATQPFNTANLSFLIFNLIGYRPVDARNKTE